MLCGLEETMGVDDNKIYQLDWSRIIGEVLANVEVQTKWWAPENWMLAELYNKFSKEFETSMEPIWYPFYRDCPYKTAHPVRKPRNENWKKEGATKYVDLCLLGERANPWRWLWLELKVRNLGRDPRPQSAKAALAVYAKDVVALLEMSIEKTAAEWEKATGLSKKYYGEKSKGLKLGYHNGVALFIQIGGELRTYIWNESELKNRIERYLNEGKKKTEAPAPKRGYYIKVYEEPICINTDGLKYWLIETDIEIK
jgi:hypothetical protein